MQVAQEGGGLISLIQRLLLEGENVLILVDKIYSRNLLLYRRERNETCINALRRYRDIATGNLRSPDASFEY